MKKSYIIAFWSPFDIPNMHYYSGFFGYYLEKYGDFQCLDFKDHHDEKTLHILRSADLVVIVMPSDPGIVAPYFCYSREHFKNIRYLVADYFPSESGRLERLCRQLRIPSGELARIPYNMRFLDSVRRGKGREYLRSGSSDTSYEHIIDFRRELKRCATVFLNALGCF